MREMMESEVDKMKEQIDVKYGDGMNASIMLD